MARLNKRVDGGYYVHRSFARRGTLRNVTYQVAYEAVTLLAEQGIRSGDKIPTDLFFELLEEGLLFTGGSGAGETQADASTHHSTATGSESTRSGRRQIPTTITDELLGADGAIIGFDQFCEQYRGYELGVLRPAYAAIRKRYEASLPERLREILATHRPAAIRREGDRITIDFKPS